MSIPFCIMWSQSNIIVSVRRRYKKNSIITWIYITKVYFIIKNTHSFEQTHIHSQIIIYKKNIYIKIAITCISFWNWKIKIRQKFHQNFPDQHYYYYYLIVFDKKAFTIMKNFKFKKNKTYRFYWCDRKSEASAYAYTSNTSIKIFSNAVNSTFFSIFFLKINYYNIIFNTIN